MQPSSGTRCLIFCLLPYTSYVRTAKALARLRGMRRLARAIAGTVTYVISTKISWAGSNFIQIKNLRGLKIIAMWGPSPNQYGPPVWRKKKKNQKWDPLRAMKTFIRRKVGHTTWSLASQLGTDAWTKKNMRIFFFSSWARRSAVIV